MSGNQTTLRYFSYIDGYVHQRALAVVVPSNAHVIEVCQEIAKHMNRPLPDILLWKPRDFLPKNKRERLRSLLKQYGGDLSKFCDKLDDVTVVSDIFGSDSRADKVTTLVAEVPRRESVIDVDEHSNEANDVLTRLQEVFRKAQQSRPYGTPSGSCQPKLYYKHQGGDFPILDGRYGDKPTTIAPPVEDFHHAFAQFKAEYQDERIQPPEEFVRQIGEFMNAVSKIETDEIRRQATIRSLLSDLLSATFGQLVDSSRTSADHVLSYSRVREPLGALAIVEENAEHGTDGDGSVRGSFSYIQHWFDANQDALARACFCPSFIISLAGPHIVICGAILTAHAIVHRLTDHIWFVNSRVNDDAHALRVARVFFALGNALIRLRSFYAQLEKPTDAVARYFPLATAYRDGDRIVKFRYTSYLSDTAEACVTYKAVECEGPSDQPRREIVVKFVERYGVAAHELLASEGLAPKLLYCGDIWLDGPEARGCGSRKMVVMECVDGPTAYAMRLASPGPLPEGVRRAIRRAVKLLHDAGMVHGDIRLENVMVANPTGAEADSDDNVEKRVRIVDFDWAGDEGTVRYPLHLSRAINWPAGVTDYAFILADDDDEMVRMLG